MIYAMSDLHGCYDKYMEMIKFIGFNRDDTLYILGDVVDRGTDGIKILCDMMEKENVVFLRGNHDHMAMQVLYSMFDSGAVFNEDALVPLFQSWMADRGQPTFDQFSEYSKEEQKRILAYIRLSKSFEEIKVNGNRYFMAHTVPEKEKMVNFNECTLMDFIYGEPDYELKYYEDRFIVTGHTPTGLIDEDYMGKIYKKNNHIAIDCGAFFENGRLGCICLDNLEEFYID